MAETGTGGPYKNGRRFWGNFEHYKAVGGRREPLLPEGAKLATTDTREARRLFEARRMYYDERVARRSAGLSVDSPTLAGYAATFLASLAREVDVRGNSVHSVRSLDRRRRGIMTCLETPAFRAVRSIEALTRVHCNIMLQQLAFVKKEDGDPLKPATIRSYAAELSVLIREAVRDGLRSDNPMSNQRAMPKWASHTALDPDAYLTRDEMPRLLSALMPSTRLPLGVEIGFTLSYTGGRRDEVLGILVGDVDFELNVISLYPNGHRGLKNDSSERAVPIWKALRPMLKRLCAGRCADDLLFPAVQHRGAPPSDEEMTRDINGTLRAAAQRAGITKSVTHHTLRHSYISARLNMQHLSVTGVLVPVDASLIVTEVGHSTTEMIRTTYGHLTRERVASTELCYGEAEMDNDTRRNLARAQHGEHIRAGLAAKKARSAAPSVPILSRGPLLTAEEELLQRKQIARQIRKCVKAAKWLD